MIYVIRISSTLISVNIYWVLKIISEVEQFELLKM